MHFATGYKGGEDVHMGAFVAYFSHLFLYDLILSRPVESWFVLPWFVDRGPRFSHHSSDNGVSVWDYEVYFFSIPDLPFDSDVYEGVLASCAPS